MTDIQLSTESLSFCYDTQPVLTNTDLNIQGGGLIGLIGPNGAGKSTLLHLLMGIHKADAGSIFLMGDNVKHIPRKALAQKITLVPQDSQIQHTFQVEDIVAMGRNPWLGRFQPLGQEDLAIIDNAMQQTHVLEYAKRPVNELSGGERQRVLIARAIAQQTPIILLDEATANLDICHQLEMLQLAKELTQQGRLVIAAIHDLGMASRFCDQVILLAQQDIRAMGSAQEVITAENLRTFFNLEADVQPLSANHDNGGLMIYAKAAIK